MPDKTRSIAMSKKNLKLNMLLLYYLFKTN